jgi:large subunit ribosomal protein L13
VNKEWVLIDAQYQVLGRLSAKVASMIRGKHKTNFSPHVDCGDNIIIINAEKVKLTGNKVSVKEYIHHTGYPGGQRFATPKELLQKDPARIIKIAVKGMLPKNRLGRTLNGNLFVYAGSNHPHEAQQPKKLDINSL